MSMMLNVWMNHKLGIQLSFSWLIKDFQGPKSHGTKSNANFIKDRDASALSAYPDLEMVDEYGALYPSSYQRNCQFHRVMRVGVDAGRCRYGA